MSLLMLVVPPKERKYLIFSVTAATQETPNYETQGKKIVELASDLSKQSNLNMVCVDKTVQFIS